METKQARPTKPEYANLPPFDGRTPKEVAENLRKEARRIANYRNRPEVRKAIAQNPKVLQYVRDMEKIAATYRKIADGLEANFGDMDAAEFAALNAVTDAWAASHPEEAEKARRDAKRMFEA